MVELASQRRRQATGSDFLPMHLQRVVAISCALRSSEGLRIWSLGGAQDGEREIVQLLAGGKSNKEVAAILDISTKTVEVHRANVMHKLNLSAFSDLVHYAIRNKIVEA